MDGELLEHIKGKIRTILDNIQTKDDLIAFCRKFDFAIVKQSIIQFYNDEIESRNASKASHDAQIAEAQAEITRIEGMDFNS